MKKTPAWIWLVGAAALAIAAGGAALFYSAGVEKFAYAIAIAERGQSEIQSGNVRNNNPGDLTDGTGNLIVYPTLAAGWSALYSQLQRIVDGTSQFYTLDMSIADMAQIWAADGSDWANNVSTVLGVPASTPLGSIL